MPDSKRVLSCIQPTGRLHLGRYFGAIQNWERLQHEAEYTCSYGIVDLHAMTMPYDAKKLNAATWELVFNLMACGLKAENLFIQSLIPEHTELNWIFNCMTGFGELGRMTQFKDKSKQVNEHGSDAQISAGLYTYPVLQAADILIYKADYVPIGRDQEQHLELSRNLAGRFNHRVGKEYFTLPEALFTAIPKVMSTADPTRKMSASLGDKHNIDVFAEPERIRKQIRSAVTDAGEQSEQMSPGIENLFGLLTAAGANAEHSEFLKKYQSGDLQYGELKQVVGDVLVAYTEPMRSRKQEILADKKNNKERIRAASAETRKRAQETVREVKDLMGLLNVRAQ